MATRVSLETARYVPPAPHDDDGVARRFTNASGPGDHVWVGRYCVSRLHQLEARASAELDAEAGQRYWLKQEVDNIFGVVRCRPVWIAEHVATELLADARHEVLVGVPGSERLRGYATERAVGTCGPKWRSAARVSLNKTSTRNLHETC